MKTLLFSLTIFLGISMANAQQTIQDYSSRWRLENDGTDDKAVQDGISVSGQAFTATEKMEGEYSAFFDGVDDYIQVDNNEAYNEMESLTFSFWLKPLAFTTTTAMTFIAGKEQCFRILMNKKPKFFWIVATEDVPWYSKGPIGSTTIVEASKWYFITASYDGDSINLYVDGKLESHMSDITGPTVITGHNITFGGLPGDESATWFNGFLDDVRLYNFALDTTQVKELYNSYFGSTGIKPESENAAFRVFPNPANHSLNMEFDNNHIGAELEVFSITGQLVDKILITGIQMKKDISQYQTGFYFLKIKGEPVIKLLKQ